MVYNTFFHYILNYLDQILYNNLIENLINDINMPIKHNYQIITPKIISVDIFFRQ